MNPVGVAGVPEVDEGLGDGLTGDGERETEGRGVETEVEGDGDGGCTVLLGDELVDGVYTRTS